MLVVLPLFAVHLAGAVGVPSLLWGFVAAAGLFGSVALHELAHAVVALAKGIRVREICLLPIGGVAQLEQLPRRPRDEWQIALAGPVMSFALALLAALLLLLFGRSPAGPITLLFMVLGGINLMLGAFNLLPSFPMDGGRILRAWLSARIGLVPATLVAVRVGRAMAILFVLWGLWPPFNVMLLAVAVFIYTAAGAEYRMIVMQERRRNPFTDTDRWSSIGFAPPDVQDDRVEVSPPPYARPLAAERVAWTQWMRRQKAWLKKQWQRLADTAYKG